VWGLLNAVSARLLRAAVRVHARLRGRVLVRAMLLGTPAGVAAR
jgi:hypothetical protein